jgi:3' exoribonuclease, RNase T-like
MSDFMIDIETLSVSTNATILTIAAQSFDPLGEGHFDKHYYARISLESQEDRHIDDETVEWWSTQPPESVEEALGDGNRIDLSTALSELADVLWLSKRVWFNGPCFDAKILEHAYQSYGKSTPWAYYEVRDARTVYGLHPTLVKTPPSHHALEDCRRQIDLLQRTLKQLEVKDLS